MVKAPRGLRHRTRKLMRKSIRERGAVPSLSKILIDYKVGDKVYIDVDPAIHGGMPHRRYIGKVGKVVGFRGRALIVEVEVGSKVKKLFLLPEHVRPAFDVKERVNELLKKLAEISKIRREQRVALLKLLKK
ncbi:50S ribosomal protein L21e [Ignisphaera sp. 4213-co]|uniref:Large ribosomal subunit protein eL21 n=1 Tax=Ignisphaera cupida TaxID=3050454 RepID=A0ABD4Z9D0_9CREN|nr:50S ribosomal protein L21e [Ignisphaera sp. 4213-co]MDK6029505.1 50S ribosomal protein L21e [Ignisphaera sp. 4213-co]